MMCCCSVLIITLRPASAQTPDVLCIPCTYRSIGNIKMSWMGKAGIFTYSMHEHYQKQCSSNGLNMLSIATSFPTLPSVSSLSVPLQKPTDLIVRSHDMFYVSILHSDCIHLGAPVLKSVSDSVTGAWMDCHMMVADPARVSGCLSRFCGRKLAK
jgi:hypothetical protein